MSLVAEMILMTRDGSRTTTMNSALLTARVIVTANCSPRCQHEIVPATGEHHDGDHHQGDRDGHEHDALGVHQDPEHGPGDLPRTAGGRGRRSSSSVRDSGPPTTVSRPCRARGRG